MTIILKEKVRKAEMSLHLLWGIFKHGCSESTHKSLFFDALSFFYRPLGGRNGSWLSEKQLSSQILSAGPETGF